MNAITLDLVKGSIQVQFFTFKSLLILINIFHDQFLERSAFLSPFLSLISHFSQLEKFSILILNFSGNNQFEL